VKNGLILNFCAHENIGRIILFIKNMVVHSCWRIYFIVLSDLTKVQIFFKHILNGFENGLKEKNLKKKRKKKRKTLTSP